MVHTFLPSIINLLPSFMYVSLTSCESSLSVLPKPDKEAINEEKYLNWLLASKNQFLPISRNTCNFM